MTSRYDDRAGLLQSAVTRARPTAVRSSSSPSPGVVATLGSVVAGAAAGIAGLGLRFGRAVRSHSAQSAFCSRSRASRSGRRERRCLEVHSSTLFPYPGPRVTEPSDDYSTGVKPNARSASGAESRSTSQRRSGRSAGFSSSPSTMRNEQKNYDGLRGLPTPPRCCDPSASSIRTSASSRPCSWVNAATMRRSSR